MNAGFLPSSIPFPRFSHLAPWGKSLWAISQTSFLRIRKKIPTNWSGMGIPQGLGWNPHWKTISSFFQSWHFGLKNLSKPHGNHFSMDCHVFQSGFFPLRIPMASRHSVSKKTGFLPVHWRCRKKMGTCLEVINLLENQLTLDSPKKNGQKPHRFLLYQPWTSTTLSKNNLSFWAIWISWWFCWCFHKSVWSTRMWNPRPPTMRKTFEAQLLQFTLGIIFELKTPLVSEGGRYVVTSLKPSKKLMKWKPFKRLEEPGCFQHSRHVFFQRIDRNFIFATLPRCCTVPHSTQSSRRRSYHERGMLYCQCWDSNAHGWAMTFQHICCKIWGFTDYTFHIKRSLCKKNSPKLQIYESWWGQKTPILIHPLEPPGKIGFICVTNKETAESHRSCSWLVRCLFFQWIIVIVDLIISSLVFYPKERRYLHFLGFLEIFP